MAFQTCMRQFNVCRETHKSNGGMIAMARARYGCLGLGGMGSEIVRNLLSKGEVPAVYNRTRSKTDAMVQEGALGTYSLEEFVNALERPRIIWLMLTAGKPVDEAIFGGGAFGEGLALIWNRAT
jgi:3-hydroxyisobutyrate dehydrogenase-like beta-hydroxyacid dehydrogenase